MKNIVFWLFAIALLPPTSFAGNSIENVTVIALSPLDSTAVVRLPDNTMQVLKPGDSIQGTNLSLARVMTGKLVLTEDLGAAASYTVGREVWLFRPVNGKSRVEYFNPPK